MLLCCAAATTLSARPAYAHDYDETRRLLLTVAADGLEALLVWELPAGPEAERLRGMIDLDRDGVIAADGWEPIVQTQLLGPRLLRGIAVELDGTPVALAPDNLAFRDGAGEGSRRGFVAMLLLRSPHPLPGGPVPVRVSLAPNTAVTELELQLGEGVSLVDSPLPAAPDAPVIGPLSLIPGEPTVVTVALDAPR